MDRRKYISIFAQTNRKNRLLAPFLPYPCSASPHVSQVHAEPAISVKLDDVTLTFDTAPRVDKGVTYVPFRTVGEALGIQITWNSKTQTVKAIGEVKGQTTEVFASSRELERNRQR